MRINDPDPGINTALAPRQRAAAWSLCKMRRISDESSVLGSSDVIICDYFYKPREVNRVYNSADISANP